MSRGKYHLVVGMDDITNTKTLEALAAVQKRNKEHLKLGAYISADCGATFHPKFSWFRTERGGVIVVGSGNLTAKGLRRNVEAFAYNEVSEAQICEVEAQWNEWLSNAAARIREISDAEVIEKAEQNARRVASQQTARKKIARQERQDGPEILVPIDEQDEQGAWSFDAGCQVLIAEIPNNNARWSQANFDVRTFREYFGAQPGINGIYRLIMRNVLWDGTLGAVKFRPAVSVASRNYRIELANPSGRAYPLEGRPIGVFVKVAERTFLYMIVFPDQNGHGELRSLVNARRERPDRLVRYRTTAAELQATAPELPMMYYLV